MLGESGEIYAESERWYRMSDKVKIIHEDGTVVYAEQYGNGRWVIRNT